jgi:hypothetical protein
MPGAMRYSPLVGIAGEDDLDAPDLNTPRQQPSGPERPKGGGNGRLNGGHLRPAPRRSPWLETAASHRTDARTRGISRTPQSTGHRTGRARFRRCRRALGKTAPGREKPSDGFRRPARRSGLPGQAGGLWRPCGRGGGFRKPQCPSSLGRRGKQSGLRPEARRPAGRQRPTPRASGYRSRTTGIDEGVGQSGPRRRDLAGRCRSRLAGLPVHIGFVSLPESNSSPYSWRCSPAKMERRTRIIPDDFVPGMLCDSLRF